MSPARTLRALFFDVDDTLFDTTAFAAQAREKAVDAMRARGLRAGRAETLTTLSDVVAEFGSNDDRHFDRLLMRLPRVATEGCNRDYNVVAAVTAYHDTKWRELKLEPGAERLLTDLAATELRLGVISSGLTRKQIEKILRLGLDRFVDHRLIFITDQIGIAKRNPLLYRRAVEAAGVEPREAMHVGDHATNDVEPAAAAGLRTVWHHGIGKYAGLAPKVAPDHEIRDFTGLREILRDHYGIAL
jgi:putative hydrolase of the HAD superfamily